MVAIRKISIVIFAVTVILGILTSLWFTLGGDQSPGASPLEEDIAEVKEETPPLDPSVHNYSDISLARQMVIYNQQAIELATIVQQDTADEDIAKLAEDTAAIHGKAAVQYAMWLKEWNESYMNLSDFPREDDHDAYPTSPGMPRVAELDKMIAMSGSDREREFLRLILQLHKGVLEQLDLAADRIQYGEMKNYIATDKAHYSQEAESITSLIRTKGY